MADLGVDVSGSNFKPAKSLAGSGIFGKVPRTMSFAPGHPIHDLTDGSPITEENEENKAPAVVILSKKASSTTRKKIIAPRTQREPASATGSLNQSIDISAAEAQLEKLKNMVMSKSTVADPVKPVRAVKSKKGKTEREVSTAETLPAKGSPKKKVMKPSVSVASTSHSSMGRT